jgi:hypothetical protein
VPSESVLVTVTLYVVLGSTGARVVPEKYGITVLERTGAGELTGVAVAVEDLSSPAVSEATVQ